MGSANFETYATGRTPKEAFNSAVEQALYEHGHEGYTGTIAEKENFTIITPPSSWKGREMEYAELLLEEEDERISNKWGPAGCIHVFSEPLKEEVAYSTTTRKYKQEGTRKWETFFEVHGMDGRQFDILKSQTQAEASAKSFAKQYNVPCTVEITKKLVNGHSRIITVHPKTKEVVTPSAMHTYLFFGYASS